MPPGVVMMDVLWTGGPLTLVIVGVGLLGLLLTALLAGLGATRRRVPLAAFAFVPLVAGLLGLIGTWLALRMGAPAVELGALGERPAVAAAVLSEAFAGEIVAWWTGALLFAASAYAAGIGALRVAGSNRRVTPLAALVALAVGGLGALGLAGFVIARGLSAASIGVAVVLMLGTGGVALASVRRTIDETAFRVAGLRFTAAALLGLGMAWALTARGLGHEARLLAGATPEPAAFFWVAVGLTVAVMLAACAAELGEVVERATVLDLLATLVMIGGFFGTRALAHDVADGLRSTVAGDGLDLSALALDPNAALPALEGPAPVRHLAQDVGMFDANGLRPVRAWSPRGWRDGAGDGEVLAVWTVGSTPAKDLVAAMGERRLVVLVDTPDGVGGVELTAGSLETPREQGWMRAGDDVLRWGSSVWPGRGSLEDQIHVASRFPVLVSAARGSAQELVETCALIGSGPCHVVAEEVAFFAPPDPPPPPGGVRLEPRPTEGLDTDRIARLLQWELAGIARCGSRMRGVATLTVAPGGGVTRVAIDGLDAPAVRCLKPTLARVAVPGSGAPATLIVDVRL